MPLGIYDSASDVTSYIELVAVEGNAFDKENTFYALGVLRCGRTLRA